MSDDLGQAKGGLTIMLLFERPEPWPPNRKHEFPDIQFSSGRLFFSALPDASFEVWSIEEEVVEYGKSKVRKLPTISIAPIRAADQGRFVILIILEKAQIIGIAINGKVVHGEVDENLLVQNSKTERFARKRDFVQENKDAINKRGLRLHGLMSNGRWRHPGLHYDFEALNEECAQIFDLYRMVSDDGRHYHVSGLLARERLMVAESSGRLGLLQLCAAHLDLPLVFSHKYSYAACEMIRLGKGGITVFPIAGHNGLDCNNNGVDIDLDVWLDELGASGAGRTFTNRDVIKELGDGLGSHRWPRSTSAARLMKRRLPLPSSAPLDDIALTALNVAEIIMDLGQKVWAEYNRRNRTPK